MAEGIADARMQGVWNPDIDHLQQQILLSRRGYQLDQGIASLADDRDEPVGGSAHWGGSGGSTGGEVTAVVAQPTSSQLAISGTIGGRG